MTRATLDEKTQAKILDLYNAGLSSNYKIAQITGQSTATVRKVICCNREITAVQHG